jgi:hypothetical protein
VVQEEELVVDLDGRDALPEGGLPPFGPLMVMVVKRVVKRVVIAVAHGVSCLACRGTNTQADD